MAGSARKRRERVFKLDGCELRFFKFDPKRHLGYHKPFVARELLASNPDISALFYADPDITFIAPWKFFEEWTSCGVALCADSNFPRVSQNHPWRCEWAELIAASGLQIANAVEDYANSGFFGMRRQDAAFLDCWVDLTEAFDRRGGNTHTFNLSERTRSITGDQDLMAAAMMAYSGRLSFSDRKRWDSPATTSSFRMPLNLPNHGIENSFSKP